MILGFTKTMSISGRTVPTNFEAKIESGIKIHTIRHDITRRWKLGMKIHFATGVRSSRYNCFKEGICQGVQEIEIVDRTIKVDGVELTYEECLKLSKNDGFDTLHEFWQWFDCFTPFKGVIIHWTKLLY